VLFIVMGKVCSWVALFGGGMVKEGCSSSKRGGTIAMVFTPLWLDWKEWEHSTVRKGNSSVIRVSVKEPCVDWKC